MTGENDHFSLREAAALLGLSVPGARWLLNGRALEEVEDEHGRWWERVPRDALITYLRRKITPPEYTPPLPPDLGDPADLAFARAEIRASVARLSNTLRNVTAELDAIQRRLIELDKREAAERAYLPLVTSFDRLETLDREDVAQQTATAAREHARQERQALRERQRANTIVPGSGRAPHPDRYVGEGQEDEPGAYAYRTMDGRLYFLYRKATYQSGQSVRQNYFFSRPGARWGGPDERQPVASVPTGYDVAEGSRGGAPRVSKKWISPQEREPQAQAQAERRRAQRRATHGYVQPGTGPPPSAERLLDEEEVDVPSAYAYRTPSGRLHFLYLSESTKRYHFVFASPWSSQPTDWKPVASPPDGYYLHVVGDTPYLKKARPGKGRMRT